jgi:hypothetical protein
LLVDDPVLVSTLRRIRETYRRTIGHWGMVSPYIVPASQLQVLSFLTNIHGFSKEEYERTIIPQYSTLARKNRLRRPRIYVGSYDSFIDLSPEATIRALQAFLKRHYEGIRISVGEAGIAVTRYASESVLSTGVPKDRLQPYQPVYVIAPDPLDVLIAEFEHLLNSSPRESQLEMFLKSHYRDVFGTKYDRIETQLWLRFPGLDISGQNRRTDLFLRNAVTNDWELFELKRADVSLTGTYRDVPALSHEVYGSIQQLRNYSRLLAQREVRDSLARRGIEYYEPELSLVVGRAPAVTKHQWRWLMAQTRNEVRVTTYGDLLAELRTRAADRRAAQQGDED